jgi:hypothetical protein
MLKRAAPSSIAAVPTVGAAVMSEAYATPRGQRKRMRSESQPRPVAESTSQNIPWAEHLDALAGSHGRPSAKAHTARSGAAKSVHTPTGGSTVFDSSGGCGAELVTTSGRRTNSGSKGAEGAGVAR